MNNNPATENLTVKTAPAGTHKTADKNFCPIGEARSTDEAATDRFGDIEEALVELFEADSLLSKIDLNATAEVSAAAQKVKKALHLLDRPWN